MGLLSFLAEGEGAVFTKPRSRVLWTVSLHGSLGWLLALQHQSCLWCFVSISRVLPSVSCNSLWQERGLKTNVWLLFQICVGFCRVPKGRGLAKPAQEAAAPLAGSPLGPGCCHTRNTFTHWAQEPAHLQELLAPNL